MPADWTVKSPDREKNGGNSMLASSTAKRTTLPSFGPKLILMFWPPTLMTWSTWPPVLLICRITVPPAWAKPRSTSVVRRRTPAMPGFVCVEPLGGRLRTKPPAPSEKVTPSTLELTLAAPIRISFEPSARVCCSKTKSPESVNSLLSSSPTSTVTLTKPDSLRNGPGGSTRDSDTPAKLSFTRWPVVLISSLNAPATVTAPRSRVSGSCVVPTPMLAAMPRLLM